MRTMHNGRLLIKLDKVQEQSKGGIHIPDQAKEKPISGIVIEEDLLVDGIRTRPPLMNQRVYFSPNAGYDIRLDGNDYLIINHADIFLSESIQGELFNEQAGSQQAT